MPEAEHSIMLVIRESLNGDVVREVIFSPTKMIYSTDDEARAVLAQIMKRHNH